MNPIYRRYRTDEAFRAAVIASAHRQRGDAMARFFAATIAHFTWKGRSHAARTHFARQG